MFLASWSTFPQFQILKKAIFRRFNIKKAFPVHSLNTNFVKITIKFVTLILILPSNEEIITFRNDTPFEEQTFGVNTSRFKG